MKLFYVYNIDWDVLGRSRIKRDACAEALQLPARVYVYAEDEDSIADTLSDRYGWCIRSLNADEWNDTKVFPAD